MSQTVLRAFEMLGEFSDMSLLLTWESNRYRVAKKGV
jgi:hypothetical protein